MSLSLSEKSIEELRTLIDNHRRRGMISAPAYVAALEELERRVGGGLEFGKSLGLIADTARKGGYLSYKDLAEASGLPWNRATMGKLNRHLGELCEWAKLKGLPMLSAIVVRQESRESGELDGTALEGFIRCARDLELFAGGGEEACRRFLEEQRQAIRQLDTSDIIAAAGEGRA